MTWAETVIGAPWPLLVLAFWDTAVLTLAIHRLQYRGWRLAAKVFLLFYDVKTSLVGIEAVYELHQNSISHRERKEFANETQRFKNNCQTAVTTIFYTLPNADTPTFDLSLIGTHNASQVILHSEIHRADDSGKWLRNA